MVMARRALRDIRTVCLQQPGDRLVGGWRGSGGSTGAPGGCAGRRSRKRRPGASWEEPRVVCLPHDLGCHVVLLRLRKLLLSPLHGAHGRSADGRVSRLQIAELQSQQIACTPGRQPGSAAECDSGAAGSSSHLCQGTPQVHTGYSVPLCLGVQAYPEQQGDGSAVQPSGCHRKETAATGSACCWVFDGVHSYEGARQEALMSRPLWHWMMHEPSSAVPPPGHKSASEEMKQ